MGAGWEGMFVAACRPQGDILNLNGKDLLLGHMTHNCAKLEKLQVSILPAPIAHPPPSPFPQPSWTKIHLSKMLP